MCKVKGDKPFGTLLGAAPTNRNESNTVAAKGAPLCLAAAADLAQQERGLS